MSEPTIADLVARLNALEAELTRMKAQARATPENQLSIGSAAMSQSVEVAGLEPSASRRDLLRTGVALLGAAMVGGPVRPVEAANGDTVVVGGSHTATSPTSITLTGFAANPLPAIRGEAANTFPPSVICGVQGVSNSEVRGVGAIVGTATASIGGTAGVMGEARSVGGIGVFGTASSQIGITAGVLGDCYSPNGNGVRGMNSNGGAAVVGVIPYSTSANGIAVYGENRSSGAGGFGCYGYSEHGHGIVGATGAAGSAAVAGSTNGTAGAYAGVFWGPVVVSGDLAVLGAKSAAVSHPDGSHRRVYCVESPESWFDDFGKAQLLRGAANVPIDPDFAAIADMEDYHVFVTVYDQYSEPMVSERTACGFRVTTRDEASSAAFSWRVVARRKDIACDRLAPITIPPAPTIPAVSSSTPDGPIAPRSVAVRRSGAMEYP